MFQAPGAPSTYFFISWTVVMMLISFHSKVLSSNLECHFIPPCTLQFYSSIGTSTALLESKTLINLFV